LKHTPGPWQDKPETHYVPAQVWTYDGEQLAEVYGKDRQTTAANARLMAAAPGLDVAARHAFVDISALLNATIYELAPGVRGQLNETRSKLKAAIEKASGEQ
jgi:hypothetical protein